MYSGLSIGIADLDHANLKAVSRSDFRKVTRAEGYSFFLSCITLLAISTILHH